MSYAEIQMWQQDLLIAGWEEHNGLWRHDHVGGIHNLKSAIAVLKRWIDR